MQNTHLKFNDLYSKHVNEMYSYGVSLGFESDTVMDAIHDVFLYFFENNVLAEEIRNIKFYLLRSLKNRLISLGRKPIQYESLDSYDEYSFDIKVSGFYEIENEYERKELIAEVENALKYLTSRQREAVFLYYVRGLSYEEVAALLDITTKGARKLIYRSIDSLRKRTSFPVLLYILWGNYSFIYISRGIIC